MDSSRSWSRFSLVSGLMSAAVVLATSGTAAAQNMMTTTVPSVVFDARRALPMFPALGYRDGFFIEHSPIGDFGLHVRATGVYGKDPLGSQDDNPGVVTIDNRFTLHAAALLSIAQWVELGVTMPFVLYQDSTGFNLNSTAIGDLRLLGKVNLHLPKSWPQVALSMGLGFETASNLSGIGAGGISAYPRLIIDLPRLLGKRLMIAGNFGAVIAGITQPCNTEGSMTTMMTTTMDGMTTTTTNSNCESRALGLGQHFIYGAGVSGLISEDQGLYLTTELLGSVSVGIADPTRTPLFWDIGIRRSRANATFFAASYGIGLTSGSPSHTVMVSLGLIWESKPPPDPKKKENPTLKVEINLTGLPPGVGAQIGKGGKGAPPPADGAPAKPAADKPHGEGAPPPPPPKAPTTTISAEIDVPEGLVPAGGGEKPAGGGGGGKPPAKKH